MQCAKPAMGLGLLTLNKGLTVSNRQTGCAEA